MASRNQSSMMWVVGLDRNSQQQTTSTDPSECKRKRHRQCCYCVATHCG